MHADDECNAALAAYLASIFGVKKTSADVARYILALQSEGFNAPEDLDELTIEVLAATPFNFKQGHLLKIKRIRQNQEQMHQF